MIPPYIMDRSIPEPNTGCWLWMLGTTKDGYAQASQSGVTEYAHRVVWVAVHGPIPRGLVVDHTCRTRSCVNPDHLRVVTRTRNVLQNSVSTAAKNLAKPCCPKCGGVYTTPRWRSIQRICLPCRREYAREYHRRKRGTPAHKFRM